VCAKRTIKNFDQVKVVLPMIFMSFGCTMVTLRSEKLLYMNTSYYQGDDDNDGDCWQWQRWRGRRGEWVSSHKKTQRESPWLKKNHIIRMNTILVQNLSYSLVIEFSSSFVGLERGGEEGEERGARFLASYCQNTDACKTNLIGAKQK